MFTHVYQGSSAAPACLAFALDLIGLVPAAAGAADSGAWELVDPWLAFRGALGMAYDSTRGVAVMFGGFDGETSEYYGDTWEYNGQRWVRRSTVGPSPRSGAKLAYDSRCGVTILFGGGIGQTRYGDTWEWDGVSWTQRSTQGPNPRWWPAMAYDEHRGVVVLHGGSDPEHPGRHVGVGW